MLSLEVPLGEKRFTFELATNQILLELATLRPHSNGGFVWRRWDGNIDRWRDADNAESELLNSAKVRLIKLGLNEYKEGKDARFSYSRDEIKAVRKFRDSAEIDIEFLLSIIESKQPA